MSYEIYEMKVDGVLRAYPYCPHNKRIIKEEDRPYFDVCAIDNKICAIDNFPRCRIDMKATTHPLAQEILDYLLEYEYIAHEECKLEILEGIDEIIKQMIGSQ